MDDKSFAVIRSKGDRALFGGYSTFQMKKKLSVPDSRPLADFLPTLTIKAKDFAAELTSHNVIEKDLLGEKAISAYFVYAGYRVAWIIPLWKGNFYLRRVQACNMNPDFDSI